MKVKVLHIVNMITHASIEYELACKLDSSRFDVVIVSFLKTQEVEENKAVRVISLCAKSKADLYAIRKLDQIIRQDNIDIIHTHQNVSGSIARILAKKNNVPVIVNTEHGSHSRYKFWGNLVNDLTLFLADKNVNVSNWVNDSYQYWEKIFLPRGKNCVIYNGVDLEKVSTIRDGRDANQDLFNKYGIGPADKVFINVARLTKVKNQAALIRGFTGMAIDNHNLKLVIIGEGELQGQLHKLVRDLKMEKNILFTGLIPRDSVYWWMKKAHGFVMNSHSEGLSAALLQAMAFEKPCILSNIPSFIETLKGENIGEFIEQDNDNIEGIRKAFQKFLSTDENTLKTKGARARKIVEKYYSFNNTVRQYEDLYMELMSANKRMG